MFFSTCSTHTHRGVGAPPRVMNPHHATGDNQGPILRIPSKFQAGNKGDKVVARTRACKGTFSDLCACCVQGEPPPPHLCGCRRICETHHAEIRASRNDLQASGLLPNMQTAVQLSSDISRMSMTPYHQGHHKPHTHKGSSLDPLWT